MGADRVLNSTNLVRASLAIALLTASIVPGCGDGPVYEPAASGNGGAGGAGGKGSAGSSGSKNGGDAGEAGVGGEAGSVGEAGSKGSGGSGGSAGSAGSGGSAGSAGSSGSGGSGGSVVLMKCDACEAQCADWQQTGYGTELCFEGPGTAQGGPAESFPLALLCGELVDCMLETGCAKAAGELVDCYCGTSGTACQTAGGANGECKDQIEAAAESTDFGDIGARFGDPLFALGRAQIVFDCYRAECPVECLPE
jgi:hypothetical protein